MVSLWSDSTSEATVQAKDSVLFAEEEKVERERQIVGTTVRVYTQTKREEEHSGHRGIVKRNTTGSEA